MQTAFEVTSLKPSEGLCALCGRDLSPNPRWEGPHWVDEEGNEECGKAEKILGRRDHRMGERTPKMTANHSTCELCGAPSVYLGDPCKCGSDNCYRCTACGDEDHD